jgi:hypothetical protein
VVFGSYRNLFIIALNFRYLDLVEKKTLLSFIP